MIRNCLFVLLVFSISTALADGSLAHFDDALGRHGVFRKDGTEEPLVLYLSREKSDTLSPVEEQIILELEQLETMETELRKIGPEVRDISGHLRLSGVGKKNGKPYRFSIAVDKQSFVPILRAIHTTRQLLTPYTQDKA